MDIDLTGIVKKTHQIKCAYDQLKAMPNLYPLEALEQIDKAITDFVSTKEEKEKIQAAGMIVSAVRGANAHLEIEGELKNIRDVYISIDGKQTNLANLCEELDEIMREIEDKLYG